MLWHPDFCPTAPSCIIDVAPDWGAARSYARMCSYHQALKDGGLADAQVFSATLQSSRVKEAARATIIANLGSSPDPIVGSDGNFTFNSGASGLTLLNLKSVVATALGAVVQPIGTSTVTVT